MKDRGDVILVAGGGEHVGSRVGVLKFIEYFVG